MTHFSPQIVATVATRTSTSLPSIVVVSWPSWGRRRSTMFIPAMILMRLTSPSPMAAGSDEDLLQGAVDAEADPDDLVARLDVHVGGAVADGLGEDPVDDLDDGCVVGHDVGVGGSRPRASCEPSTDTNAWTRLSTPPMAR